MIAAYLMGEPGVGKSALMAYIQGRYLGACLLSKYGQFTYREFGVGVVIAGADHELYPGTDTLSFTAVRSAEDYISRYSPEVFLAEGDRLANDRFFSHLDEAADAFTIVHLVAEPGVLAARRAARGSDQSPSWLVGRATKTANLAKLWAPRILTLDASASVVDLADRLVAEVPAFAALTGKP